MDKKIVSEELLDIASSLVKIPSYSFMENSESAVAACIAQVFQKEGIETELVEVLEGRPNIYENRAWRRNGKGHQCYFQGDEIH